jgi:hypothetical protein
LRTIASLYYTPTTHYSDYYHKRDPLVPNSTTATMQRNIVIFLIILILFILIAAIAYLIYYLQTRMAVGGTASSVSDMTENV